MRPKNWLPVHISPPQSSRAKVQAIGSVKFVDKNYLAVERLIWMATWIPMLIIMITLQISTEVPGSR